MLPQLSLTPWYNDDSGSFAIGLLNNVVQTLLGSPNTINDFLTSPYFAFLSTDQDGKPFAMQYGYTSDFGGLILAKASSGSSGTFAVSAPSAVPEPLTILGAMTAAGFGAGFKRKLANSKKDQEDA